MTPLKNPIVTAVAGLLVGFFVGWVLGQGQPGPPSQAPAAMTDPHAGVPGAPPLGGMPERPPAGGRTAATGNPELMQRARNLEQLLAKDPNNYENLVEMGNVEYDMNNYVKASDWYEKARAIRDDSPDLLTDLGVCYRESGKPAKALELFDRAADMAPNHWKSRYNAAVVRLFDLQDAKGAKAELDKLEPMKGKVPDMPDLTGLEQEIAKKLK